MPADWARQNAAVSARPAAQASASSASWATAATSLSQSVIQSAASWSRGSGGSIHACVFHPGAKTPRGGVTRRKLDAAETYRILARTC